MADPSDVVVVVVERSENAPYVQSSNKKNSNSAVYFYNRHIRRGARTVFVVVVASETKLTIHSAS